MQDLTIPLLQGAGILAVAGLLRRRWLVLLAALTAAAAGLAVGFPADPLGRPPMAVAQDLTGVWVGTLLGLLVGRPGPDPLRSRAAGAGARRRGYARGRWLAAAAVLALAAAVGLYLDGRSVPQWRATVDHWLGPLLEGTSGAAPGLAGRSAAVSGAPVTTGTAPVSRAPAPATERPRGDLRHCLEQASPAEVRRCAERAPAPAAADPVRPAR